MLDSLNIRNFRNLQDLRIESLGSVNLITGKNNTGKSTVLEAIALYASKGDLKTIYQLLDERGEYYKKSEERTPFELKIKSLASLFTNRVVGFEEKDSLTIGTLEETLFGHQPSTEKSIQLRFVKYYDEVQYDNAGSITARKRKILDTSSEDENTAFKVGFEARAGSRTHLFTLEEDRTYGFESSLFLTNLKDNFHFIRTRNIDREENGKLFDRVALTEKEQYVVDALKIIERSTERIAFIEENSIRQRRAVIKLSTEKHVLPLRSMGDGINRILTIVLALVNCDNGFLLIDEFENGLHYSVQEQLWKVIFSLSQKLNVQVFATTHSEDCIMGFKNILNTPNNLVEGKLIRLDNIDGNIRQVEYDADELSIAMDQHIETR